MDDKTNTDYRDINNFDDKWKITGIDRVNCDKNGYENSFLDILGVPGVSERSFLL